MAPPTGTPRFFATPAALRAWLEAHHETEPELLVGLYKTGTGTPSITWPESVREALCVGWIDGVRHSLDAERYTIRFTPRKAKSRWSAVNVKLMQELIAEGRVHPAGLAAWERRPADTGEGYSTATAARAHVTLDPELERMLRADRKAWADFSTRPPRYRANVIYRIMSAKRVETREKRVRELIAASRMGRVIGAFDRG